MLTQIALRWVVYPNTWENHRRQAGPVSRYLEFRHRSQMYQPETLSGDLMLYLTDQIS